VTPRERLHSVFQLPTLYIGVEHRNAIFEVEAPPFRRSGFPLLYRGGTPESRIGTLGGPPGHALRGRRVPR